MDLVLCSTCRLPIRRSLKRCSLCNSSPESWETARRVSLVTAATAAVTAAATIAILAGRRALRPTVSP